MMMDAMVPPPIPSPVLPVALLVAGDGRALLFLTPPPTSPARIVERVASASAVGGNVLSRVMVVGVVVVVAVVTVVTVSVEVDEVCVVAVYVVVVVVVVVVVLVVVAHVDCGWVSVWSGMAGSRLPVHEQSCFRDGSAHTSI
jgi:hypothetical protein